MTVNCVGSVTFTHESQLSILLAFSLRPAFVVVHAIFNQVHRMTPKYSTPPQKEKQNRGLPVASSPKFHSVSLYD